MRRVQVVLLMGGKVGDPGPPMPALSDAALQPRSSVTDLARRDVHACMTVPAVRTKEVRPRVAVQQPRRTVDGQAVVCAAMECGRGARVCTANGG
ncbi:hypothetical protein FOA52_006747 [Chlamydomonas sp. UWO 241]|nr:hypothetical protein FOA52_006747 [Chlamydomonas sp. UWO 241]